jgi:hypothetical protein
LNDKIEARSQNTEFRSGETRRAEAEKNNFECSILNFELRYENPNII